MKKHQKAVYILLVLTSLLSYSLAFSQAFVHPGVMHTNKDLNFVKSKIQAGIEPWKTSFNDLKSSTYCSLNYSPKPFAVVACGSFNNPNDGCDEILDDQIAAYTMALRWYMEGNKQYADKAISILMTWTDTYQSSTNTNTRLVASAAVTWFVNASELLRYNYSGWTSTHTSKINGLLNKLKPNIDWADGSGYNNWKAMGLEAQLSMAVFQDDRTAFNNATTEWKMRIKTYIYQKGDGATPIIPPGVTSTAALGKWREAHPTTSYIDGQCMETCRDFNHAKLGVISYVNAAEVAWNQGVDLFSLEKERIKDFYELHGSWMLGTAVPSNICEGTIDWKGTTTSAQEAFDLAYNHLHDRLGLNMPYTLQMIQTNRPNGAGRWCKKWETFAYANRSFSTTPTNQKPTVGFSTPANNTVFLEGYNSLVVAADASDSDGTIAKVELFIDGNLIRQETGAPYEWGHATSPKPNETVGLKAGSHILKLVATDDKGAISTVENTIKVNIVTGLEDSELMGINIYPNPSKTGIFQLSKVAEWEVFNSNGILVEKGNGNSIDISNQNKGLYMLKMGIMTQKLIIE